MVVTKVRDLPQAACLKQASGFDNYGRPKMGDAEEVAVRWEEDRRESLDRDGNRTAIDATAWVDHEVTVGSEMWLGSIYDYPTPDSGRLYKVTSYSETPDLRGGGPERTVTLVRKSDTGGDDAS